MKVSLESVWKSLRTLKTKAKNNLRRSINTWCFYAQSTAKRHTIRTHRIRNKDPKRSKRKERMKQKMKRKWWFISSFPRCCSWFVFLLHFLFQDSWALLHDNVPAECVMQPSPDATDVPHWVTTSAVQPTFLGDSDSFNCKRHGRQLYQIGWQLLPCNPPFGGQWQF